jgi:hypothetical protein
MQQVERSDVESGRNGDACTEPHQLLHEVEASLPVIEASIDVRGLDVN